jgi:hypothetical protein
MKYICVTVDTVCVMRHIRNDRKDLVKCYSRMCSTLLRKLACVVTDGVKKI